MILYTLHTLSPNYQLESKSFQSKPAALVAGAKHPRPFFYITLTEGNKTRGTLLLTRPTFKRTYHSLLDYWVFQRFPGKTIEEVRSSTTYTKKF